jgi:hypothetical protein
LNGTKWFCKDPEAIEENPHYDTITQKLRNAGDLKASLWHELFFGHGRQRRKSAKISHFQFLRTEKFIPYGSESTQLVTFGTVNCLHVHIHAAQKQSP